MAEVSKDGKLVFYIDDVEDSMSVDRNAIADRLTSKCFHWRAFTWNGPYKTQRQHRAESAEIGGHSAREQELLGRRISQSLYSLTLPATRKSIEAVTKSLGFSADQVARMPLAQIAGILEDH